MKKPVYPILLIALAAANLVAAVGLLALERPRRDTAPQITFAAEPLTASVRADESALLQGVTAWDEEDGDLTAAVVVEAVSPLIRANTCRITYAVADSRNQVTRATREVFYADNEPPRFRLSAPLIFTYNTGFNLWDVLSAVDSRGKNLSARIRVTLTGESPDINTLGVWPVNLKVADDLGNTADLTLNVTVEQSGFISSRTQPMITLSQYLVYLPAGSAFDAADYLVSITVNQAEIPLNADTWSRITVESPVDPNAPGVYTVKYHYTSENGIAADTELVAVVQESSGETGDG